MTPDDHRHGTPAGYVAGCRGDCCRTPRMRQQKLTRYAVHQGRVSFRTADEFAQVAAPWLRLGLSLNAVMTAAGVDSRYDGRGGRVAAATYDAVAALTEDQLGPNMMVFADLTRRRIYSLMAAGHELQGMPINSRGVWRRVLRFRVGWVRVMRDYYAAQEFVLGPNRSTAARARNSGHVPPLAWDDPGTLAWPSGKPERILLGSNRRSKHDVDPMVVDRVLAGEKLQTTQSEKRIIRSRWLAAGRSEKSLCDRMGWKEGRYAVPELEEATA